MAASYPTGFDTMSDPGSTLSGAPTHSSMHNQVNDVVEAIEVELGLNPSGVSATVAARFTALDALVAHVHTNCTAATRPGSPTAGDTIYETDTLMNYYWNGTIWASAARGLVASSQVNTVQSTTSATPVDVTSVTFTGVAGRRYRATASCTVRTNAGVGSVFLTDGSSTVYDQNTAANATSNTDYKVVLVAMATIVATGSYGFKIRASIAAANTFTFNNGNSSVTPTLLLVEDMGV